MKHAVALAVLALLSGCVRGDRALSLTISAETTSIIEPLRSDGTPDYSGWLNRKYGAGVSRETNAAVALAPLLGLKLAEDARRQMGLNETPSAVRWIGGPPAWDGLEARLRAPDEAERLGAGDPPRSFGMACLEQMMRAHQAPWIEGDAPLMAAWLRVNSEALAQVEAATERPRFFIPLPEDLSSAEAIPPMVGFRHVAQALRARILLQLGRGEIAGAVRDLRTGLRLASLLSQDGSLVARLVAEAMRSDLTPTLPLLARSASKNEASARSLIADIEALPPVASPAESLDVYERSLALSGWVDLLRAARRSPQAWQQAVRRRTSGMEAAASSALERIPAEAIDWDELLRTVNRCWGRPDCADLAAAARADLEPAALDPVIAAAATDADARRRLARAILFALGPPADSPGRLSSRNEGEALLHLGRACALAVASRSTSGRYPEALDMPPDDAAYAYRYIAQPSGGGFAVSAELLSAADGSRSFCADSSGRLAAVFGRKAPVTGATCDVRAQALVGDRPSPPR